MADETVPVRIVYIHDPETDGPDLNRVDKIEWHDRETADWLIRDGQAVKATAEELELDQERRAVEVEAEDLPHLTKDELRARLPEGVEVSARAGKGELVAAVEDAMLHPGGAEGSHGDDTSPDSQ